MLPPKHCPCTQIRSRQTFRTTDVKLPLIISQSMESPLTESFEVFLFSISFRLYSKTPKRMSINKVNERSINGGNDCQTTIMIMSLTKKCYSQCECCSNREITDDNSCFSPFIFQLGVNFFWFSENSICSVKTHGQSGD